MIIKAMAITRCPYCHAIIDENDKYCNNCGTQLLFTEDEEIEEEIPGEKIIEADVEEKDYTVDEPESEKRPAAKKDLDSEIDEELDEKAEETALDKLIAAEAGEEDGEDVTEEVILVDEIETAEAKSKDGSAALEKPDMVEVKGSERDESKGADAEGTDKVEDEKDLAKEGKAEAGGEDKEAEEEEKEEGEKEEEDEEEAEEEELADELEVDLEEELDEDVKPARKDETREYAFVAAPGDQTVEKTPEALPLSPEEPHIEYVSRSETPDAAATAGEAGLRPATFDSQELENLGKTVDLSGEKIDKFLEVMTEKKVETGPVPAESAPGKTPEPPTGTLPPWASTMRGAPVFPEETGPVETRKIRGGEPGTPDTEEVEIFPRQRASDSTMGLPEKVSQAPLPFERRTNEMEEGEEELEEEGTVEEEAKDLTPAEVVLPGGQVGHAREPFLPVRERGLERPDRTEVEAAGEVEEAAPRPPFSFSFFLRSKTFDLLFVGLFWLVALWLAAYSMGLTLFGILGSMSGSMLLLYAVFVLLYFFLFKFFLGETLGDRLFRPRE
jgi:hypothetical protein